MDALILLAVVLFVVFGGRVFFKKHYPEMFE